MLDPVCWVCRVQLKTVQSDGLIVFASRNLGLQRRIFAVELHRGQIRFVFGLLHHSDLQRRSLHVIEDPSSVALNDGHWHGVSVQRPTLKEHILRIDDSVTVERVPAASYYEHNKVPGRIRKLKFSDSIGLRQSTQSDGLL